MTKEDLADLIRTRTDDLADHTDGRLAAMQSVIYGQLLAVESNMRNLRDDIASLRQRIEGNTRRIGDARWQGTTTTGPRSRS